MGLASVVLTPVFVYGPLACPEVLKRVCDAAPHVFGRLDGVRVTQTNAPLPLAGLSDGAGAVDGVLIAEPEAVARLVHVAEVLGLGAARPVVVTSKGASQDAQTWPGQPGPLVWDAEAWTQRSAPILQEALKEIVRLTDRATAAEMAGRLPMILSRAAARVAAAIPTPAELRSPTQARAVQEIACEITHAGFFQSRTYTLRHPRFDGTLSDTLRRELFVATDAALVLPYDPVRDRVLLVEQFRMGPYGRGDPRPWMLEPVAGRIDGGESPEQAARRECVEEAGLTLRGLEKISTHYCTPGYSTEVFHLFLGICDLPDMEKGHGGLVTEHEDIRTHVIDFSQAMALVQSGEANNGPLILSLLWLERERARLSASA